METERELPRDIGPASPGRDSGATAQTEWTIVDDTQRVDHRRPRAGAVRRPTWRFMLSHPAHGFSLGFGSGLSRIMPGTCGTLFGWLSFVVLNPYLTPVGWWALIVAGFVAGIWLCGFTADKMQTPDPGAVVWDEIVAIWIVMLFVMPTGFTGQLGAFLTFRFFDMVKPPPIRYFDRRLKGGFGIMFDDLVAAFFSLLVIAWWRH